jgi:peptidoglycan L-alanyl-D-glutamate endopeptidase CwlK
MDYILQEVADVSLITGHRNQHDQNEAYYATPQRSKLPWPKGKHNQLPSLAVDFQPYPYPARNEKLWASLAYVAGSARQYALSKGVVLRWGGDWDGDGDLTDQNFDDLFHLEIVETPQNDDTEDRGSVHGTDRVELRDGSFARGDD